MKIKLIKKLEFEEAVLQKDLIIPSNLKEKNQTYVQYTSKKFSKDK
jgi:hypothetical protein